MGKLLSFLNGEKILFLIRNCLDFRLDKKKNLGLRPYGSHELSTTIQLAYLKNKKIDLFNLYKNGITTK